MARDGGVMLGEKAQSILQQGGFLTLIIAGVSGLIGWRIGSAKDSVRVEHHGQQIKSLNERLDTMARSQAESDRETATTLAKLNVTLESMSAIMTKLEKRLSDVEHDQPRRPGHD